MKTKRFIFIALSSFIITLPAIQSMAGDSQITLAKSGGLEMGTPSVLALDARIGANINKILEAGVEARVSPFGIAGGGLYTKVPIGSDGWYGIVHADRNYVVASKADVNYIDSLTAGIGKEFHSGFFIEARAGQMKRQFNATCLNGNCPASGQDSSVAASLTVGAAF